MAEETMEEGSKPTVEDQPETEEHEEGDAGAPLQAVLVKRRRLELARIDVMHHLELAHAEAHREMLKRALAALEQELERLV